MKPDQLLILSTEEYSDYGFSGPYKVLKEFRFKDIVPLVYLEPLGEAWKHKHGPDDVTSYLIKYGYIEKVECREVHLGCYGRIEVRPLGVGREKVE